MQLWFITKTLFAFKYTKKNLKSPDEENYTRFIGHQIWEKWNAWEISKCASGYCWHISGTWWHTIIHRILLTDFDLCAFFFCCCRFISLFFFFNSMANISYHRNRCFIDWGLSWSQRSICSVSAFCIPWHQLMKIMAEDIQCTYTVHIISQPKVIYITMKSDERCMMTLIDLMMAVVSGQLIGLS